MSVFYHPTVSPRGKLNHVDCCNWTPLHVAVGTHESLSIVQLLANACPEACAVQDLDGRTPLHLACDRSCQLFKGDCNKASSPPSINVSLEDNDGTTTQSTQAKIEHAAANVCSIEENFVDTWTCYRACLFSTGQKEICLMRSPPWEL